jgi:two-component system sensor histidine kinase/response regulator
MIATSSGETRPTVLAVDDSPVDLELIVGHLSSRHLRMETALDGEEALRKAESVHPDLILLDVMMPGMSGFETCRELKHRGHLRDVPVIFVTDLSDPQNKVRGFEVGGVDYVTKPIEANELCARVDTQLRLQSYRQGLEGLVASRTAELQQKNRELDIEVAERRRLQSAYLTAADNERRYLAQELHDGLGQDLVGAALMLDGAMGDLKAQRPITVARLARMGLAIRNAVKVARDIAHGLAPLSSTAGGLLEALHALRDRMGGSPGLNIELDVDPRAVDVVSQPARDQLYRIAQEAASNAMKHARANRIKIGLNVIDGAVRLEIADDGCGMSCGRSVLPGLGLHTMRDRAASIGGTLQLVPGKERGTVVICEVPKADCARASVHTT